MILMDFAMFRPLVSRVCLQSSYLSEEYSVNRVAVYEGLLS